MRVLNRPDLAEDFTMKRIRHTPEQIIRKLKTAEQLIAQGKTVSEVCRVIEVTQPTYLLCLTRMVSRAAQRVAAGVSASRGLSAS